MTRYKKEKNTDVLLYVECQSNAMSEHTEFYRFLVTLINN